ncbi:hypothetical protein H5392_12670 [Tessaracoccus sp. MC1865]|uniref:hypothetical protein n=1 Tax=Tessaracoccus sp. MC1865 TaxID=2760310 RepID=UPI0016039C56|nr:hypothetical protein [Tessaracoccus sp. MC1865]MBB1484707.1 hypothetical protein [Tessaracoccus sp. MC1865]QTO36349.1 hypothetical protein J7D54_07380 [Tessaracoccus sp. MC1865]
MISWVLGGAALMVAAFVLLSPLESLRWWADKGQAEIAATFDPMRPPPQAAGAGPTAFVVYLSGVAVLSGDTLSDREDAWLAAVAEEVPGACIISEVFPYAVDNRGLLHRTTMGLWKVLGWTREHWHWNPIHNLINIRNIAQVLVSADPRYGPTFNIGLAQELWRALQRHGYRPGSGTPVTLMGLSGGVQMALGAGWFLHALKVPVSLISIGGIFGDDPGLDRMRHLWHLTGTRDHTHHLGTIAFPGRWPTSPLSTWNRAKREGRVSFHTIGPMGHDGPAGYYGRRSLDAQGRSHFDLTRDAVVAILREEAGA